ncbi:DUF4190 domain-containing protein [Streptomyces sp. AK02-01A]|uniref:DUF4190 domain-containing protein n=1 Tax=Streptomyces sp. AK02-01A TaxID=3028648 RepID=UPI0029B8AA55|nr:DUF4190 domain-containing protein [Streptomyces sp. AK02-01A]MDX3854387.1 DUF4190 domain-containing protein [Streptomyces sp. AK02-01A]
MSDQSEQPSGGYEPSDPWAPPERKVPLDKPGSPPQPGTGPVHDQPTVAGIPGTGSGALPPPPIAPGGPAQPAPGPYGYPAAQPGPSDQQSASPYGTGTGYGYPTAGYQGSGYPAPDLQSPGYPTAGYPGYGQTGWQETPSNGMGIAAMVLGIIAVAVFCIWGLGVILGVLALIFGIIGRRRARRGQATNGGMALAGIILGAIGAVISGAFVAFLIWVVANGEELGTTDGDPFATSLVVGADRTAHMSQGLF